MKVGIYFRKRIEPIIKTAKNIISFLEEKGAEVFVAQEVKDIFPDLSLINFEKESSIPEILISLGGDGTFLRASHYAVKNEIPVLGVNLGYIGFLTNVEEEEILSSLHKILERKYRIEERTILQGSLIREGKEILSDIAINDFVIQRDPSEKVITTEVFIGKDRVAFTRGDGIIISTPTGSTAYSLAAGGPIIDPRCRVFMITPLCSHKLSNRSIIIPENEILTISMATKGDKTRLINDGVSETILIDMDRIKINVPPKLLKIAILTEKNFYDVLNKKFQWGL
jgi:NAD+ kinase